MSDTRQEMKMKNMSRALKCPLTSLGTCPIITISLFIILSSLLSPIQGNNNNITTPSFNLTTTSAVTSTSSATVAESTISETETTLSVTNSTTEAPQNDESREKKRKGQRSPDRLSDRSDFGKRPFYNIAHMVNSIKEVKYYLDRGANAIEADVAFSPNGSALYTYHGYPCDCFRHCTEREDITRYLTYIREITRPESAYFRKELSLLFLDLKISNLPPQSKAIAGRDLADKVADILYNGGKDENSNIKVLLSIGHIYDSDFVLGFQARLESRDLAANLTKNIGWDVGLNDPIGSIVSMWRKIEVIDNIWLGDGRTNCLSPWYNLGRLTQAVDRRDENNAMIDNPYVDKVYHWTIDLTHNLRASLRTGVDGIITNHPERLSLLLREPEFRSKLRLADHADDPWMRIPLGRGDGIIVSPSGPEPIGVLWATGAVDFMRSLAKFLRDFVFLRNTALHNIGMVAT